MTSILKHYGLLTCIILGLSLGSLEAQEFHAITSTWYVDGDVMSSGDGISWATAFQTIQEAVDAASSVGSDCLLYGHREYRCGSALRG